MKALINLPSRLTKTNDQELLKNTRSKKRVDTPVMGNTNTLEGKIALAKRLSYKLLGDKLDKLELVTDINRLQEYINKCIENKIVAFDTETDGLDTKNGICAGFSLYTPGEKAIYVPVNHISYMSLIRLKGQLTVGEVSKALQRLEENNVKWILHNSKFDMHVAYWLINEVKITPYWDTQIGANLLNENEQHGLKYLHDKYCAKKKDSHEIAKFNTLFDGIKFPLIPIDIAYIYAANDALITYEVYLFQKQFLNADEPKCQKKKLERVAKVFHNIEIPLIPVVWEMEKTGVCIDEVHAHNLQEKYGKLLAIAERNINRELKDIEPLINKFCNKNPELGNKLSNPINIGSPVQLAILLYDILGFKSPDKKSPRGTGEDILKSYDDVLCNAILDYRSIKKYLSTYIEALPNQLNPKTGRLHGTFNQYGAATGRFSSSDPNLQNIPSKAKKFNGEVLDAGHDIRNMFIASPGNVFIGSDYSQQEPRCLAYMSGDEHMLAAYRSGKDLYAVIASKIYKLPYEDCLEFNPDGTPNPEGKKRRSSVKPVLLGLMYGRGEESIAEVMEITKKEAAKIIADFFTEFPKVEDFVLGSQEHAEIYGYVETVCGRKRRLPDMQLEPYEIYCKADEEEEVPERIVDKYMRKLNKAWGKKQKDKIKEEAKKEGYIIKDNTLKIGDATRQCVNSIIQGSSADITKMAMIKLGTNEELKKLKFQLVLTIHDEVIGECPRENMDKVSKLVKKIMIDAAKDIIDVPMNCDVEVTERWYGEAIS